MDPIVTPIVLIIVATLSAVGAAAGIASVATTAELTRATNPRKVKGIYYAFGATRANNAASYANMCRFIAAAWRSADRSYGTGAMAMTVEGTADTLRLPLRPFVISRARAGIRYRFKFIPKAQQGAVSISGYEIRDLRELIPPKEYWVGRVGAFEALEAELFGSAAKVE
jgi:hypothetical protein